MRNIIPFLTPVPGSRFVSGRADASPLYVQLPGAHQPELVANGSIVKNYQAASCLSVAALVGLYRNALLQAG